MTLEQEIKNINLVLDEQSDKIWALVAQNEDIKEDNKQIQGLESCGRAIDILRIKLAKLVE